MQVERCGASASRRGVERDQEALAGRARAAGFQVAAATGRPGRIGLEQQEHVADVATTDSSSRDDAPATVGVAARQGQHGEGADAGDGQWPPSSGRLNSRRSAPACRSVRPARSGRGWLGFHRPARRPRQQATGWRKWCRPARSSPVARARRDTATWKPSARHGRGDHDQQQTVAEAAAPGDVGGLAFGSI